MSDPRKAYYVYRARHPQSTDIALDEFVAIYRLGGSDVLRESAQMASLTERLRELIWWLEAPTDELDVVDEADRVSAYWKTS